MNTIEIRVTEAVTVENFRQQAAEGNVQFYRVRGNGTTRHIPFFAEGTKDREVAEWVAEQREDGVTMKALATELHLSVPSVRRILNSLLLSEEVDEYEDEDIAEILAVANEGTEPEVGEVMVPSEEEWDGPRCTNCSDGINKGTICTECASGTKPVE
jgi:hypothetical protein